MLSDRNHVIEVRQPSGTTVYVTTFNRDGGITCRTDLAKARRLSKLQAEGHMYAVKQALRLTPAVARVVALDVRTNTIDTGRVQFPASGDLLGKP